MREWLNRRYYQWCPKSLFLEAVDYLNLNDAERINYVIGSAHGDRGAWAVLLHIIYARIYLGPAVARDLYPLWEQLWKLGMDKGWVDHDITEAG